MFYVFKMQFQNKVNEASKNHCVKCVQLRSFFWSVFSRIRTEYAVTAFIQAYKHSLLQKFNLIILVTPFESVDMLPTVRLKLSP